MINPLHAEYYADHATWHRSPIVENVQIAEDTFRLRVPCASLAERIVPGQFVMIRIARRQDPLLARPLALYDTYHEHGRAAGIDVVYLVKGKLTTQMQRCRAGDEVEIWGPLGNGFSPTPVEHLIMVAGGIGQTPFLALGAEFLGRKTYGLPTRNVPAARRVTLCYGARRASMLAGVDDFRQAGFDVRIATDDGSQGYHGLVTDLLRQTLAEPSGSGSSGSEWSGSELTGNRRIVCCGPEPMMAAVSAIARETQTKCQVSLETPMACGIGICFTCVARVRDAAGAWDYKRTCVDGPIFDSEKIEW